MKIRICKWEKFNDVVENRIHKLEMNNFISLLEKTHNNIFLYKKIYEPDFTFGYYNKSYKSNIDDYLNLSNQLKEKTDITYPKKSHSLVCNINEEVDLDIGTTFLVFPFKDSLFTINDNGEYYKGYWKDKIKWLDKFNNSELWTENECILVKKTTWEKIKKNKI
jgi:hypothetical protein